MKYGSSQPNHSNYPPQGFKDQVKLKDRSKDDTMFIDWDFLRAPEYGIPTASGIGIDIDRLYMFMMNEIKHTGCTILPDDAA